MLWSFLGLTGLGAALLVTLFVVIREELREARSRCDFYRAAYLKSRETADAAEKRARAAEGLVQTVRDLLSAHPVEETK